MAKIFGSYFVIRMTCVFSFDDLEKQFQYKKNFNIWLTIDISLLCDCMFHTNVKICLLDCSTYVTINYRTYSGFFTKLI